MSIEKNELINTRSWDEVFNEELDGLIKKSEYSIEDVVNVILNFGILEHLSPTDLLAYQDRIDKGKIVFKRDDPELYDFLLKDLNDLRKSVFATLSGGYSSTVVNAWTLVSIAEIKPENFKKGVDGLNQIIDMVENKLKEIRAGLDKNGGSVVASNESESSSSEE